MAGLQAEGPNFGCTKHVGSCVRVNHDNVRVEKLGLAMASAVNVRNKHISVTTAGVPVIEHAQNGRG